MTVPPTLRRIPPTPFPPAPESRTIQLPGGATLTGMADLPANLSDQCNVSFNLMLQLGPFLGSMECVIKLLKAVGWLMEFVQDIPKVVSNPIEFTQKLAEGPPILADLATCITAWTPIGYCTFIKDVLTVVRDFLQCVLELLDSILLQQLDIQVRMGEAQGNPELLDVLEVASANADRMAAMAASSCGPAFALLDAVGAFLEPLGAGGITPPSIDDLTGGDASAAVQPIRDVVDVISAIIEVLPC